jgi:hypothetical protein
MSSSGFNTALPTNIPWRRLATSQDMMDRSAADRRLPLKWKTSLSLFYYKPVVEGDIYPDSNILYLKVVCSITGYQVDARELGVDLDRSAPWSVQTWNNFNALAQTYYPCYGAVLQVAVLPGGDAQVPLGESPLIIDFEPKKREMFELVSDSGEVLSHSATGLRVAKGATTTSSMESVDVSRGFAGSAQVSSAAGGAGGSLSTSYDAGSRQVASTENVNVRTIDDSRERRETLSHTTQLAQMYQLLESYHLGTNRALFALFPRPHIVDVETSLVNGLRKLEGIQEFFLVVEQPKHLERMCVTVQLETSHLHKTTHTVTQPGRELRTGVVQRHIEDMATDDTIRRYTITVPDGTRIDRTKGRGGFEETVHWGDDETEDIKRMAWVENDQTVVVEVNYDASALSDAFFKADYKVYWVEADVGSSPTVSRVEGVDLFMTGRYLSGCLRFDKKGGGVEVEPPHLDRRAPWADNITFEERIPRPRWNVIERDGGPWEPVGSRVGRASRLGAARELNEMQGYIRERAIASFQSLERDPDGAQSILEADFALRALARGADGKPFRTVHRRSRIALPATLAERLGAKERRRLEAHSIAELVDTPSRELSRRFDLSRKEVSELKLAQLGVPLSAARKREK